MAFDPRSDTQPTRFGLSANQVPPADSRLSRRTRKHFKFGCGFASLMGGFILAFAVVIIIYLLAPARANILLLGIDYTPPGSSVGRSDTIVLMTVIPSEPYVGVLSIPRDLWVNIPGVGENRINTAHFFAEVQQPGSGPQALERTIEQNFAIKTDYFVRIRFEAVRRIVDAMGGVDIVLDEPMAGYPAGRHHLTGNKALEFARHRLGGDDFFRMEQGQLLVKSIIQQMLHPTMWLKIPAVVKGGYQQIDTNIPWWQIPRLGAALLRAGPDGIDSRMITREMASPFITGDGASVLLPDWGKITPVVKDMFGE